MPIKDSNFNIESWDPKLHDSSGFSCGVAPLDNFLKLSAKKQQKIDMTRVHVAVEHGKTAIVGYYAINVGSMNVNQLPNPPKVAPRHGEIPVLFLGQVAVDLKMQGHGLGTILMQDVFDNAYVIAKKAGCHGVLLDVMSDGDASAFAKRKGWYEEFGFESFPSNEVRMFISMKQIRKSVEAEHSAT